MDYQTSDPSSREADLAERFARDAARSDLEERLSDEERDDFDAFLDDLTDEVMANFGREPV